MRDPMWGSMAAAIAALLVGCHSGGAKGGGPMDAGRGDGSVVLDGGQDAGPTLDAGHDAGSVCALVHCDDGDPCTADACDPTMGCTHTFIDGDGDGYAPAALGTCADPSKSGDCDDSNVLVHPNQPNQWYVRPYCVGAGQLATGSYPTFNCPAGVGQSFDYDCSGSPEGRYASRYASCSASVDSCTQQCSSGRGWQGPGAIPGCGGVAPYIACDYVPVNSGGGKVLCGPMTACDQTASVVTQGCH